MKKIYESPISLFVSIEIADVLTASNNLFFNFGQNVDIDDNDVRSFNSFFNK